MNEFTVYFKLFSRKFKTTVLAETPQQAEQIVRDELTVLKIDRKSDPAVEYLKKYVRKKN